MAQRDEKNLGPEEEDFSDITEFRPEGDAFLGDRRPVPMKGDRSFRSIQDPGVIILLCGIALLLAGLGILWFSQVTKNQRAKMADPSSMVPESRVEGSTSGGEEETELTSVTISEKTKVPGESSGSDAGDTVPEQSETESAEQTLPEETERSSDEAPSPAEESTESAESETAESEASESGGPSEVEAGGVVYLLENGEATVLTCRSADAVLVLPGAVEGLPLEGVNDEAFSGCTHLCELVLPDSVCWIGARAFAGCEDLYEVTMGSNINAVSEEAFEGTSGVTIVAPKGSYAEEYAREKGLSFRAKE